MKETKIAKKAPKRVAEPTFPVRIMATGFGFDINSYKFRSFLNRFGLSADDEITQRKFDELFIKRYKKAL